MNYSISPLCKQDVKVGLKFNATNNIPKDNLRLWFFEIEKGGILLHVSPEGRKYSFGYISKINSRGFLVEGCLVYKKVSEFIHYHNNSKITFIKQP